MICYIAISFGGLISGIGRGIGAIAKASSTFLPGPASGIVRTIGNALNPSQNSALNRLRQSRGRIGGITGGGITRQPQSFAGGGGGGAPRQPSQASQARANAAATGLVCPPGERPNKSRYFLMDGTRVDPGTRCVKVRRMEVGNSRALRRSQRREAGFVKLARRALKGTKYRITTASSSARRGPRTIVESGSGSVVTR